MRIDCSNDILSAGNRRKQEEILLEYSKLIKRNTDVAIPFYKMDIITFESIWPPHNVHDEEECFFWRRILSKSKEYSNSRKERKDFDIRGILPRDYDDDLCSGKTTARCSVAFLDDVQYYNQLMSIGFAESPGIYIKDPLIIDNYLFDFIIAYNIHLAETYYLSNRKSMCKKFYSIEIKHFKSFINSFLTIKSLFKYDERMARELIQYQSPSLVGSWKIPFVLLKRAPEKDWKDILNNREVVSCIEDILSGEVLGDVEERLVKIAAESIY